MAPSAPAAMPASAGGEEEGSLLSWFISLRISLSTLEVLLYRIGEPP